MLSKAGQKRTSNSLPTACGALWTCAVSPPVGRNCNGASGVAERVHGGEPTVAASLLKNRQVEFAIRICAESAARRPYVCGDIARRRAPVRPGADPLIRMAVLQRAEDDFEVVSIITTSFSTIPLGILHREWMMIYDAL